MELHRLADANAIGDGQRAALAIHFHDIADQKIAGPEIVAILADDASQVQAAVDERLLARGQGLENVAQLVVICLVSLFAT